MSHRYMSPPLVRRPSRTAPVTILGVLLVAGGVVAIIAAIYRLQNGSLPQWLAWGRGHMTTASWLSNIALTVAIVIGVIALLLVIWAFKPGRTSGVFLKPAEGAPDNREIVMDNSDLTGWVSRWINEEDGVASSSVKRRGNTLKINVKTDVNDPEVMRDQLTRRVADRVESLGLEQSPNLKVRLR
ncbi:DUF6286 domain-containing protein [Cutibacterium equinum]|uniref:DUF6286 domain-containing protein n=1 Tax=Cutibacterium equinum TaxID=3016342 RepID=A0ABY7QZ27_9ACTN|nr:DUF6286 domain-containing protein [Cutibacterium equinum]WCC80286.1 DUF6286 domain-containing protein [Cutibacterium equinum]